VRTRARKGNARMQIQNSIAPPFKTRTRRLGCRGIFTRVRRGIVTFAAPESSDGSACMGEKRDHDSRICICL